jgi:hypothetical protein
VYVCVHPGLMHINKLRAAGCCALVREALTPPQTLQPASLVTTTCNPSYHRFISSHISPCHHTMAHAAGVSLPPGPLWDAPSAFFALRSERDREDLARVLTSSPALGSAVPRALAAAGNPAIPAIIETHGLLLEAQVCSGWLLLLLQGSAGLT